MSKAAVLLVDDDPLVLETLGLSLEDEGYEVGEMGPAMQVKLLRVLQDGQVQRVGDTVPRKVEVRIIAATNRDLEEEVAAGRFRQDLYFRLTGIEIRLPPLRQRREDIPLLARHFLEAHNEKGQRRAAFSQEALELLEGYGWPGNVREMEKEVERAATLAGAGEILPEHFSARLRRPPQPPESGAVCTLNEMERRHIQAVLQQTGWNIQRAAKVLGIHRNTLARKVDEYGLRREG